MTLSLVFMALVSKAPAAPLTEAASSLLTVFVVAVLPVTSPLAPFAFPTSCKSDDDPDVELSDPASSSSPLPAL